MAHIHTWRDNTFSLYLISAFLIITLCWISRSLHQARKRLAFLKNGMDILREEKEKYEGVPFQITTAIGEATILPPDFIPSHRFTNTMSLRRTMVMEFHAHLPGFEIFGLIEHPAHILQSVARKQMTQHLSATTEPLSAEAAFAAEKVFSSYPEWREVYVKDAVLDVVARLSSRVFLGPELCRNEAWLRTSQDLTITAFGAAAKLNLVPVGLRRLANIFDPSCRRTRELLAKSRAILLPVFEQRSRLSAAARAAGNKEPAFDDAIEWAEKEAKGMPFDPVAFQLQLTFVAIHTTYDLLGRVLSLLAERPECVEALRKEMIDVLKVHGMSKSGLYHMKLLDSAIKETQRFALPEMLTLRRIALQDFTLPDGTLIRKGELIYTHCYHMLDDKIFPDAETFDIYRFVKMRGQPDGEARGQFISATTEHLGFGYGVAACPGRFFAAHEMKVMLCHFLLKYDWRAVGVFRPLAVGARTIVDPASKIRFRRRVEEVDLAALRFGEGGGESAAEVASG
ncbi:cytochrome p450 [Colletotrichum plurivorum]|uniref:Cytochrome p450 n=1 Tax=Colletotrichum plurivorum TaxID=2175906 RepID=A0A8H6K697_9PEZI|nr:cytochrome p450 [Colletotrichum plurivorum]